MIEDIQRVPTPEKRCQVLQRLHDKGIKTVLMARPILPDSYIRIEEIEELIEETKQYIDAVVSSGIAVNKEILAGVSTSSKQKALRTFSHNVSRALSM